MKTPSNRVRHNGSQGAAGSQAQTKTNRAAASNSAKGRGGGDPGQLPGQAESAFAQLQCAGREAVALAILHADTIGAHCRSSEVPAQFDAPGFVDGVRELPVRIAGDFESACRLWSVRLMARLLSLRARAGAGALVSVRPNPQLPQLDAPGIGDAISKMEPAVNALIHCLRMQSGLLQDWNYQGAMSCAGSVMDRLEAAWQSSYALGRRLFGAEEAATETGGRPSELVKAA